MNEPEANNKNSIISQNDTVQESIKKALDDALKNVSLEELENSKNNDSDSTKQRLASFISQEISISRGPIPPPEIMAGYGKINKSFPDRIMKMAERNREDRIELYKKDLEKHYFANNLRVIAFTFIILVAIAAVVILVIFNHEAAAAIIGTITSLGGGAWAIHMLNRDNNEPQFLKQPKNTSSKEDPEEK
ncbi:DUF2335 domain-containing protein [Entomobacter blattae]|uniref:DUF2335 domain-containing protein n=1 Tax=Entomobacter blattae TaxID=2762277 RepID=A0A7H1NU23_9PROT|nr:DUF2335 domain-containing protein [Entomobacter blattae]QNT79283.1 hypothetical protein JGUZn3_20800 [Entomobacter blattae]